MTKHAAPIDFSDANILVIGDVMLDQYWYGESNRVSPEAPIPVVHFKNKALKIGGAANVAANIQSLGASVFLLGAIGEDSNADTLLSLLDEQKIKHHIIQHKHITTITKTRVVANGQQVVRIDEESSIPSTHLSTLYQYYEKIVENYDVIILSDYLKGTLYDAQTLINFANKYNKIVLVDPKGKDYKRYKNAFCITPNSKEFADIYPQSSLPSEVDLSAKMQQLATSLNLQALLLTRGAQGMILWQKAVDGHRLPIINIPTQAKSVYDVSGAGDTVIATLACGLSKLKQPTNPEEYNPILQESVHYANQAAGIAVAQAGSYAVSIEELNRLYSWQNSKYIGNADELKQLIQKQKSQHQKIVFTNGCFDILHSGHIHCLEEAAKLGNQLIVAINSDESVKRLKGDSRPINTLLDRIEVLSALSAVDWIIDFGDKKEDDDTPINLIKMFKPDILVKGSDYDDKSVVGAHFVNSYGGEVRLIELKKGYSSTKIIQSLAQ